MAHEESLYPADWMGIAVNSQNHEEPGNGTSIERRCLD